MPVCFHSVSSGVLTQLEPPRPILPPQRPHGGYVLRRCGGRPQRPSSKALTCRRNPSPPRYLPGPPVSGRSSLASTITGHFCSMLSIGALRTSPWHTVTEPDGPSCVGRPPQPPPSMVCSTKLLPRRGS